MATSGTLNGYNTIGDTVLGFTWNVISTDLDKRTSTVSWYVWLRTAFTMTDLNLSTNVWFDDVLETPYSNTYNTGYFSPVNPVTVRLREGTTVFAHDGDAPRTFKVSVVLTKNSGSFADTLPSILNKTATLTAITPAAVLGSVTCDKYTDEALTKISFNYDVPKPSLTTSLRFGVDFGNGYKYVALNKNNSSYTYNVSESEREIIRQNSTAVQSRTIRYVLESVVSGTTYTKTQSSSISIVNAEPDFTVSIVDVNTAMTNLTGDATNKFVKGYSTAEVTVTPILKKGAYLVSEKIVCGDETIESGSGYFYDLETSEFVITLVDSRGYKVTKTITKTLVNYITLTCNMEVDIPSAAGSTTVRLKGNCFYGSFGSKTNTLTVGYRYAASGEAYSNWKTATATIQNNNTYAVNLSVTGLDYTKGYTFEARAVDLIETTYSTEVKVKSTPIFDWGENDFNFNVPVNFEAGFTQPNSALKQLWNGQYQFNGEDTVINLSTPVSQLPNGLVLVFAFIDDDGNVDDNQMQSFFVSKKVVQVRPGALHTFFLANGANFAIFGAKSLYITDTTIKGISWNGNSGTTSSIVYRNTRFVLRDVLGV